MSAGVPSLSVTAFLYQRYFAAPDTIDAGMSSHWRAFAPRSRVQVDEAGVPVGAVGVGFGDMNVRRRGNAAFTTVALLRQLISGRTPRGLLHATADTRRASARAGLVFNQDALRQACTLALLRHRMAGAPIRRVVLIGDGYGLLGALLAQEWPAAQVVFVDLGRSLLFQAMTCERLFPDVPQALVGRDPDATVSSARIVFCPADRLEGWPPGPIDLAVNIASMQEMTAEAIRGYFDRLRRAPSTWFYCCNRERKEMPGGEVSAFMAYPWDPRDEHVLEGLCPWHQTYVAPRRGRGLLLLTLTARYDGPHLHRLTRLASHAG